MLQRVLHFLPLVALSCYASGPDSLLWNHVGYERTGPKTAVVKNASGAIADTGFQLLDASNTIVFQGPASAQCLVPGWGSAQWKVLDFSSFQDSGRYSLKLLPSGTLSDTFEIEDEALLRLAGPSVVSFFHSMESKDDGDHAIGYFGQPKRGTHDVYGGWMDATGDDGKYISHLSYANYMNPQQIPMVVWSLLRTSLLAPRAVAPWRSQLLSEAAWGADYLARIQDTQGYFYINVFRSHWNMDTAKAICAWVGDSAVQGTPTSDYQSAWREGGGMSIAALALASRTGVSGSFTGAQYLAAAQLGFDHLSAVKGRWDDDGRENLIDHYCALLAAVELYQATQDPRYADSAAERADSIVARQEAPGWFLSDDGARPFYHAVDEGLPLVALWAYLEIDPSSPRSDAVRATLAKSVQWYRSLTRGVANPFLYPRMYAPDAPPTGAASPGGDLAVGAAATSSSTQGGYPASNAVDGSLNTRWGGALGDSTASLTVDLGRVVLLDAVAIDWEAAYGKKYQLRISTDDANWTTVCAGGAAGPGWDGHGIPGDSARYVRMQGQELAQPSYGFSLYEFQVFGSVPSSPVVPGPSSGLDGSRAGSLLRPVLHAARQRDRLLVAGRERAPGFPFRRIPAGRTGHLAQLEPVRNRLPLAGGHGWTRLGAGQEHRGRELHVRGGGGEHFALRRRDQQGGRDLQRHHREFGCRPVSRLLRQHRDVQSPVFLLALDGTVDSPRRQLPAGRRERRASPGDATGPGRPAHPRGLGPDEPRFRKRSHPRLPPDLRGLDPGGSLRPGPRAVAGDVGGIRAGSRDLDRRIRC